MDDPLLRSHFLSTQKINSFLLVDIQICIDFLHADMTSKEDACLVTSLIILVNYIRKNLV